MGKKALVWSDDGVLMALEMVTRYLRKEIDAGVVPMGDRQENCTCLAYVKSAAKYMRTKKAGEPK